MNTGTDTEVHTLYILSQSTSLAVMPGLTISSVSMSWMRDASGSSSRIAITYAYTIQLS
jgi:hypothetical protein